MSVDKKNMVSMSQVQIDHQDGLASAAETSVARSLRERKSHCTACGSKDGKKDGGSCKNCGSKGKENKDVQQHTAPVVEEPEHDLLVEVEFKGKRKALYLNEKSLPVALGDLVIVEAERGTDAGMVAAVGRMAKQKLRVAYEGKEPLLRLIRPANTADEKRYRENKIAEIEALSVCKERVRSFHLDMKVTDCEWQFDHNRLTFYFTAPQQVDFRELIKDLASIFSVRIELRQISPREEAKRLGGVGVCGLELCCTSFLNKFEYITIDHAKVQGLANNPNKLSGQCGRLKCCLLYEIDYYVSALQNYPPLDSTIQTKEGIAKIFKIDIFKDTIQLYYEKTSTYATMTLDELNTHRRDGKIRSKEYREKERAPQPA